MVGQFFRPSWLGLMLMFLIVVVLTMGFTESTSAVAGRIYKPGETPGDDVQFFYWYGLPTVLEIRTAGPTQDQQRETFREVYWNMLLLIVAAAYVVAMPIGRWITGYRDRSGELVGPVYSGWRSPAVVMLCVWLGGTIVAGILVAVLPRLRATGFSNAWLVYATWIAIALVATPVTLIVMIMRRWRWRARRNVRGFEVSVAPVRGTG